ncbi:MAG TPA: GGDEF domain-containing protein [Thermoanaerobaculia bacterium]
MQQAIGLLSGDPRLAAVLRERCPEREFVTDRAAAESCRVVIVDSDSDLDAPPRKSVSRIVLLGNVGGPRRQGDIRVDRETFLNNPEETLAVADDLATVVIHASQLEQEVGYLTEIHELMAMADEEAVSERVARSVLNLVGLPNAALLLHDPRLERYVVSFSNDPAYHDAGEFLSGVPPDLLQRALGSGEYYAYDEKLHLVIIPLQIDQDLIGVIRVPVPANHDLDASTFAPVTRYLRAVVQVLGNVYQLTRSRDLAMRDDLTKAFNRRFFESYLDEEIERARRYGAVFSIIFLDLDDLKTVNNFFGHLTGSRTLQEVAKRILNAVRGIDKVVRFGGDEFCIILPQTDSDQAAAVANRVRRSIGDSSFKLEPEIEISVTASFGIATYPTHAMAKEDLIRQADLAMYRVKSTTKNAIGVATVEDATRPAAI